MYSRDTSNMCPSLSGKYRAKPRGVERQYGLTASERHGSSSITIIVTRCLVRRCGCELANEASAKVLGKRAKLFVRDEAHLSPVFSRSEGDPEDDSQSDARSAN